MIEHRTGLDGIAAVVPSDSWVAHSHGMTGGKESLLTFEERLPKSIMKLAVPGCRGTEGYRSTDKTRSQMNWQGFSLGSLGPCNLDASWHLQQSRAPPQRLIPFAHSSDVSIESPKNPQSPSLKALISLAVLTRGRFGQRMQEQQTARSTTQ